MAEAASAKLIKRVMKERPGVARSVILSRKCLLSGERQAGKADNRVMALSPTPPEYFIFRQGGVRGIANIARLAEGWGIWR